MPETYSDVAAANTEKFLIFTILGKYYTFPSRFISEVTAFDKVYPLPLLPSYVKGVINRYSVPFALIDVGLLIRETATPESKVVVLKEIVDKLAFLIDDVVDIIDIPVSNLLKVEQGAEGNDVTDIIESSFEWHDTHVFVLSIRQIINRVKTDFEL
ncbi:MAG: chemotaxis protein CheW [Spirochaetaceae bacterium]|jgi:purine-binding chemotaxis protein CheW|nr:chemotaxis protein CheW [Spirochaetaceae bacterium]